MQNSMKILILSLNVSWSYDLTEYGRSKTKDVPKETRLHVATTIEPVKIDHFSMSSNEFEVQNPLENLILLWKVTWIHNLTELWTINVKIPPKRYLRKERFKSWTLARCLRGSQILHIPTKNPAQRRPLSISWPTAQCHLLWSSQPPHLKVSLDLSVHQHMWIDELMRWATIWQIPGKHLEYS